MDTANDGIRLINSSIDKFTDYVRENAIPLAILLAILYYVKTNASNNISNPGHKLASTTTSTSSSKNRTEELRMVRERQQRIANERAKQAAVLRTEKERQEKERKNNVAIATKKKGGDKLGGSRTSSDQNGDACSYNPMQPWSSHSSGYRPARRTARRG